METFEIAGNVTGTALRFAPAGDGKLTLTAWSIDRLGLTGGHDSVILRPEWLRPLAAWLAGEAQPASIGDEADVRHGPLLTIAGDEAAVVWSTRTWARLRCRRPFGPATVTVGPRGHEGGWGVTLTPGARTEAATWLRRVDAERWAELRVR